MIAKSTDRMMGDAAETNGHTEPGVSVRFGPVQDGDVEMADAGADVNGRTLSKRKSRASVDKPVSYAEPQSSEDDEPLVRHLPTSITTLSSS